VSEDFLSFHLPDSFINEYAKKKPNWGFDIGGGNSLSELTYIAKYSRVKQDGTKEQWYETCRRCIEGMYSILKDHCKHNRTPWNEFKAQKSAQDAYDRMFHFKWTPPGRGLATMGTRFVHEDRNNASLNNPLHEDTKVFTPNGWMRLGDLEGQVVQLLSSSFLYGRDKEGSGVPMWVEGTVSQIEEQPCIEIVYNDSMGIERSIVASRNHRWFTRRASHNAWKRVSGEELREGDFLPVVKPRKNFLPSHAGMQHGFFFGDGTRSNGELHQFGTSVAVLARLFGDQVEYANRHGVVRQCPTAWGFLPDGAYLLDKRYVYGFLAGYFAADGHVDKKGGCSISSARFEELNAVRTLFMNIGIEATEPRLTSTSSNFADERELWTIRINRFDLTEEFFLKLEHRERWLATTYGKPRTVNHVRIKEIRDAGMQRVLCATVPHYEQFVTESFVLTSNCAAITTEKLSAHSAYEATMPFTRVMEMSMHGVGVGFDTRGAGKLLIWEPDPETKVTYVIGDTREEWAKSVGMLLESYFFKNRPTIEFDYSQIRPAGAPLKRFGGTASGPEPLRKLHEAIRRQFTGRAGDRITSRDIVDIMNQIGKAVVAGGARRSALIAIGDPNDEDYINLKNWELPENAERTGEDGWAWTSNNSVYADSNQPLDHLVDKIAINGEPGIIYMDMIQNYGRLANGPDGRDYRANLCNPCAEISLESHEFCCLSELYPANHDSLEDFFRSIKHAYMYAKAVTLMPSVWPETNEVITRNRRIGVSMTGIVEFIETRSWHEMKKWMDEGYAYLRDLDHTYSEWLGVRESIKLSTVKPAGTTSIIAGTTAGVHWPTTSGYYIRRVRFLKSDPIVNALIEAGYHVEPDVMDPDQTVVAEFPTTGLNVRSEREVSVWEKASLAAMAQRYWADNMVSVTVSFDKDDEADQIAPLLRSLQGQLKSISFLPITDTGTSYKQAPYEPISPEKALELQASVKKIPTKALYGKGGLDGVGEKFCNSDHCEISF